MLADLRPGLTERNASVRPNSSPGTTAHRYVLFINTSNSLHINDLRTSMRMPEFDASVFDNTSLSVAVDEIRLINVAWEDLAIDLAAASAVPEDLRQSWAHWRLGVALDRPFTPHYESTIEHLGRVSDARCD